MRRGLALGLLLGWLVGVGTGLLGAALTGGWYEYRFVSASQTGLQRLVNEEGWQFAGGPGDAPGYYLRRPRFRLP